REFTRVRRDRSRGLVASLPMLSCRTGLFAIVSCAVGCATADPGVPDRGMGGADAHLADAPRADAPGGGGGPKDAPSSSGTCATPYSGVLATWVLTTAAGN